MRTLLSEHSLADTTHDHQREMRSSFASAKGATLLSYLPHVGPQQQSHSEQSSFSDAQLLTHVNKRNDLEPQRSHIATYLEALDHDWRAVQL